MTFTREFLLSHTTPEGDCLEWTGRVRSGGIPQVWDRSERKWLNVRRLLVSLRRGKPLPTKMRCVTRCQNPACIREEHIRVVPMSTLIRECAASGKLLSAAQRAALVKGSRSRSTNKLTMEKARAIRLSPLSSNAAGRLYGVTPSLIRMIRRNELWRDAPVPGSSVFHQGA